MSREGKAKQSKADEHNLGEVEHAFFLANTTLNEKREDRNSYLKPLKVTVPFSLFSTTVLSFGALSLSQWITAIHYSSIKAIFIPT